MSLMMNKLIELCASFIHQFEKHEPRMKQIVQKLRRAADQVKHMHKHTNIARTTGAVVGGVGGAGVAVLVISGLFTGGLGFAAAAAAAAGTGTVVSSNVLKKSVEKDYAKKVRELGEELMEIVKPLKKTLKKIKTTCTELEDRSAEHQAKFTLEEVKEFQRILNQVTELKEKTVTTVEVIKALIQGLEGMLTLIIAIFRVTASTEEDEKLIDSIIQSAKQSQKVTDAFHAMTQRLKEFSSY